MDPTDNLGYLLHHFSTELDAQSDEILQTNLNVGFSQFKILLALNSKNSVQQKEIARMLGQTEASVSRQVKIMQKMGIITSKVNPNNRRERQVVLTANGTKVLQSATALLNRQFSGVFGCLSQEQQENFYETLGILNRWLKTLD